MEPPSRRLHRRIAAAILVIALFGLGLGVSLRLRGEVAAVRQGGILQRFPLIQNLRPMPRDEAGSSVHGDPDAGADATGPAGADADEVGGLRTRLAAERGKVAGLEQQLRQARDEVAAASRDARGNEGGLEQQLTDERARSSELEYSLSKALTQLAYAGRSSTDPVVEHARTEALAKQKAAAQKAVQQTDALQKQVAEVEGRAARLEGELVAARAAEADARVKREAEQAHVAALALALAAAEARAGEAGTLARHLSESRDRAASLDAALAEARARLASSTVDAETKLRAERAHTAQLSAKLAAAEAGAEPVGAVQQQLAESRSRTTKLEGDLAAAGAARLDAAATLEIERTRVADLGARLAAAEAGAGQVGPLQQRLAEVRDRVTGLDAALAAARAATLDGDAKLKAERTRVADLGARLAVTEAGAGQVGPLQQQLSESRDRIAGLDAALASAQAANRDGEAKLKVEQARVAELGTRLATAEAGAGQVDALEVQLAESHGRVSDLEARLAAARAASATEVGGDARLAVALAWRADLASHLVPAAAVATAAPSPGPEAADPAGGGPVPAPSAATADPDPGDGTVPAPAADPRAATRDPVPTQAAAASRQDQDGIGQANMDASQAVTRVTLRYARSDAVAQDRATTLRSVLQEKGWDVSVPVGVSEAARERRVVYYYGEDRVSAEIIASLSGRPGTVRGRLTAKGPLPRPGTVEVGIFPHEQ